MFWKVIRWGGTALIILILLAAFFATSSGETSGNSEGVTVVAPADPAEVQPNKNFNM
jgi:hypothetical protein